eukprot:Nk52_evm67s164 gene=Nk52_evmTU67s164
MSVNQVTPDPDLGPEPELHEHDHEEGRNHSLNRKSSFTQVTVRRRSSRLTVLPGELEKIAGLDPPPMKRIKKPLFSSMKSDLRKRLPLYFDDWRQGINTKALSSAIFMFFTSIAPAITFGNYLQEKTNKAVGTVEVLLSTFVCGTIFSIFGGQPLIIVGVTGPVAIFTETVYNITDSVGINFAPFLSWIGIWAGIMHMILAANNACDLIRFVTRFSAEIFGVLIAIIYIWNGIEELVDDFSNETIDGALLSFIVGIGTFLLATILTSFRQSCLFNMSIRSLISDYGAAIAILVFTIVPVLPDLNDVQIPKLDVPNSFQTTSGRSWVINIFDIDVYAIFLAILPAFILTVLFFFDHNVSSLLSQKAEFNLQKGTAFNYDFFIVGVMLIVCAIFGIPYTNGLIPQAPLHVRSLASLKEEKIDGHVVEIYENVNENRVSGLLQSCLIGASLGALVVIQQIPRGALSGLFLFMGFASFDNNQFAERIKFFLMDKGRLPPSEYLHVVPPPVIYKFTAMQLAAWAVIFGVTKTDGAIVFPVLILALVPLRRFVLPKYFSHDNLNHLDNENAVLKKRTEIRTTGAESETVSNFTQDFENDELDVCALDLGGRSSVLNLREIQDVMQKKEQLVDSKGNILPIDSDSNEESNDDREVDVKLDDFEVV